MEKFAGLFDGINEINYNVNDAIEYLFIKTILNESYLQGLREFALHKLSQQSDTSFEELMKELDKFCEPYRADAIAAFLKKFGSSNQSP